MAGTELGKAYVQIIPSAEGISGKIRAALDPEAKAAGESAGSEFAAAFRKAVDSVDLSGIASSLEDSMAGGISAAADAAGELSDTMETAVQGLGAAGKAAAPLEEGLGAAGEEADKLTESVKDAADGTGMLGNIISANLISSAVIAGVNALASGIKNLVTDVISGYAEFEQLTGGVETLFKESAGLVEEYAANAYRTAGLSANEYMGTVTSFSASLIQSLGGDTEAAAKTANQAITDMSDNANKMGTDMASIQNAYQGFAKANYTMLDNLNTMGALAA